MNKYSMQDVKAIQNTCFKLNSLQLQTLLSGYLYATNEPHIPPVSTDCLLFHTPHVSVVFPVWSYNYDAAFWDKSLQEIFDIKMNNL